MYVRDDDGVTTPGCDDGGGWARRVGRLRRVN